MSVTSVVSPTRIITHECVGSGCYSTKLYVNIFKSKWGLPHKFNCCRVACDYLDATAYLRISAPVSFDR